MSDNAPDRIWLGRDDRYVGEPWLALVSEFDDEDGAVSQEYVRADIHDAALARVKADRDKMKAALEYILDGYGFNPPHFRQVDGELVDDWITDVARAALLQP